MSRYENTARKWSKKNPKIAVVGTKGPMVCLDSLGEKKLAERKILRDSGYRTRGELKKAHNGFPQNPKID
jgi:hypothetical protein